MPCRFDYSFALPHGGLLSFVSLFSFVYEIVCFRLRCRVRFRASIRKSLISNYLVTMVLLISTYCLSACRACCLSVHSVASSSIVSSFTLFRPVRSTFLDLVTCATCDCLTRIRLVFSPPFPVYEIRRDRWLGCRCKRKSPFGRGCFCYFFRSVLRLFYCFLPLGVLCRFLCFTSCCRFHLRCCRPWP